MRILWFDCDNIKRAKKSGVSYVAEPGGSVRDDRCFDHIGYRHCDVGEKDDGERGERERD
ncbi:MAG: hypothetical protein IK138_10165 [Lachnospiraceae bacterium]|nr:hypothetical protein [Lachnospiraceae bacterium]